MAVATSADAGARPQPQPQEIPGERALSTLRRLVAVRRLRLQLRRPPDPDDRQRADQDTSSACTTGSSACSAASAFALFYSTFGIPIARSADKRNRVNIIALSLLVWSASTAVTGLARNFWHLFVARIGVGIGEAGCSPPALLDHQRLLRAEATRDCAVDLLDGRVWRRRFLGLMIGGIVAHDYGWRAAFFIVGVPGLVLALILKLTLREPPRGFSEGGAHTVKEAPPMMGVVKTLVGEDVLPAPGARLRPARVRELRRQRVLQLVPDPLAWLHVSPKRACGSHSSSASAALLGTYRRRHLCDSCTQRHSDPRYMSEGAGHLESHRRCRSARPRSCCRNTPLVLVCLFLYICFGTMYLAPSIAATYRLVGPRERALATALLFLVLNFIGIGLGPMLTGMHQRQSSSNTASDQGVPTAQASARRAALRARRSSCSRSRGRRSTTTRAMRTLRARKR